MASERLPGKVMKKVLGKPLIGYLLERLSKSKKIDKIILATSLNSENDALCDYVEKIGYDAFQGSEEDVLNRYYQAAKKYNAKTIIRITGDCPLIDPEICDKLIKEYFKVKIDYARLSFMYAEGVDCEVFDFTALEKANKEAKKQSEREHVTPFMKNNPDIFKILTLENKVDESQYRLAVDESEDFEVVKAIIKNLSIDKAHFTFKDIKNYLDNHPEIMKINAHVRRNEGYLKSLELEKDRK